MHALQNFAVLAAIFSIKVPLNVFFGFNKTFKHALHFDWADVEGLESVFVLCCLGRISTYCGIVDLVKFRESS